MPLWKWASEGLSGDKGGYCLDRDLDQKSPGVFSSGAVDILRNWTWSAISNTHWHSIVKGHVPLVTFHTLCTNSLCALHVVLPLIMKTLYLYTDHHHTDKQAHPTYKPICCSMLLLARKAYGWKGGTSDCIARDVYCHHCGICIFNPKLENMNLRNHLSLLLLGILQRTRKKWSDYNYHGCLLTWSQMIIMNEELDGHISTSSVYIEYSLKEWVRGWFTGYSRWWKASTC